MTATGRTEHYELSQYTEDDHPTYTGDYNGDMRKIDAAIHAASQSGMTAVTHTNDLTGNGTPDSPLGVAEAIARTESVTQAIAEAIADRLTAGDIKPGNGIKTSTSGNQVTISYAGGGLSTVAHDTTLTGDGTQNKPLGIRPGTAINPVDNKWNSIDFNDYYTNGIYTFNGKLTNGPRLEWTSGALMVLKSYQVTIQLFFTRQFGAASPIAVRTADIVNEVPPSAESWSAWQYVNFMSNTADVSALTSRITALETQVAALTAASTPSDTGLVTTQRDSQYSDDYNIVRAGTPTRSNESEETHHE